MDTNPLRDLTPEQGDGLTMALELVATTVVMGLLGWFLDGLFGTRPVLTVVLAGFTFAYEVWKLVNGYTTELQREMDQRTPLRRGGDR